MTPQELTQQFNQKVSNTISNIMSVDDFKSTDPLIKNVFDIADWVINKKLDEMSESELLRAGGRLSGIYTYLGNWASRARAERDVYEQQLSEELNRLTTEFYGDAESKITLARARAKSEVKDLEKLVIIKENEKNNYENIMNSTQSMISFIQSAIKIKQGERFIGSRLQDNQY